MKVTGKPWESLTYREKTARMIEQQREITTRPMFPNTSSDMMSSRSGFPGGFPYTHFTPEEKREPLCGLTSVSGLSFFLQSAGAFDLNREVIIELPLYYAFQYSDVICV